MAYKKKEVTPTEPEVKEEVVIRDDEIPPLPERFRGNKTIEGVWKTTPSLWSKY